MKMSKVNECVYEPPSVNVRHTEDEPMMGSGRQLIVTRPPTPTPPAQQRRLSTTSDIDNCSMEQLQHPVSDFQLAVRRKSTYDMIGTTSTFDSSSSIDKSKPLPAQFSLGDEVLYKSSQGQHLRAIILRSHHDKKHRPYYVIRLAKGNETKVYGGKEKRVYCHRLRPYIQDVERPERPSRSRSRARSSSRTRGVSVEETAVVGCSSNGSNAGSKSKSSKSSRGKSRSGSVDSHKSQGSTLSNASSLRSRESLLSNSSRRSAASQDRSRVSRQRHANNSLVHENKSLLAENEALRMKLEALTASGDGGDDEIKDREILATAEQERRLVVHHGGGGGDAEGRKLVVHGGGSGGGERRSRSLSNSGESRSRHRSRSSSRVKSSLNGHHSNRESSRSRHHNKHHGGRERSSTRGSSRNRSATPSGGRNRSATPSGNRSRPTTPTVSRSLRKIALTAEEEMMISDGDTIGGGMDEQSFVSRRRNPFSPV